MRTLRFLPLAFIAGQHGFLLFAPYLAVVLATLHMHRSRKLSRTASERRLRSSIDGSDARSLAAATQPAA